MPSSPSCTLNIIIIMIFALRHHPLINIWQLLAKLTICNKKKQKKHLKIYSKYVWQRDREQRKTNEGEKEEEKKYTNVAILITNAEKTATNENDNKIESSKDFKSCMGSPWELIYILLLLLQCGSVTHKGIIERKKNNRMKKL